MGSCANGLDPPPSTRLPDGGPAGVVVDDEVAVALHDRVGGTGSAGGGVPYRRGVVVQDKVAIGLHHEPIGATAVGACVPQDVVARAVQHKVAVLLEQQGVAFVGGAEVLLGRQTLP